MLSDGEVWACAEEMIRHHGAEAAIEAALKADALAEKSDLDGARCWRQILSRINQLQERPKGALN